MSNLEPGCLARIIKSIEGLSIGKIVQCVRMAGMHSEFGEMWWIHSKDILVTEYGGVGHHAHCPASWLKKLEPGGDQNVIKDELVKSE